MTKNGESKQGQTPKQAIPISKIRGRYLIFDIDHVTYIRREHRICGVTIGTLPQSPSQNVFLGLPMEIMPEEARLLVEKGVAFIIDDRPAHNQALRSVEAEAAIRRADYLSSIQADARTIEKLRLKEKEKARAQILKKRSESSNPPNNVLAITPEEEDDQEDESTQGSSASTVQQPSNANKQEDISLFSNSPPLSTTPSNNNNDTNQAYFATPTSSSTLLNLASQDTKTITVPSSYALYKHLNEKGYFMTPGLRFGCQYSVYPGDPLRYHSHFLAVGTRWNEGIDLMDIVGGGRLGTGVKKGYLFGGEDPDGKVRTFSVEWAVM